MRERLMEFFPGIWERVYAIAMLRTVYGPRLCKVEDNYQDSMIGQSYKGLALSPASISDLMSHLGDKRAAMDGFMRAMAGSGGAASFLIDGHRIISASEGMGDAALGYDSKMRHRPQLNLLYVFSLYRDEEDDLIKRMTGWNEGLEAMKERERQRRLRGKGQYTDAELDAMRPLRLSDVLAGNPERGTISIRTDRLDLNSRQVYSIYKQRQTIEQGFKTYDDSLMGDSSYMHSDAGFEAWLFLNHLSMMMVYDAAEEIYRKGLSNKYSFDMFRKLLTKIRAMRNADGGYPARKQRTHGRCGASSVWTYPR